MIKTGTTVKWKWGNGYAQGKVVETFKETVTRNIDQNEIKRKGTPENKALLINQEDGTEVLKLESEVERDQDK